MNKKILLSTTIMVSLLLAIIVLATTLTTFNESDSAVNISFSVAGKNATNYVKLPKVATVTDATMNVTGYDEFKVDEWLSNTTFPFFGTNPRRVDIYDANLYYANATNGSVPGAVYNFTLGGVSTNNITLQYGCTDLLIVTANRIYCWDQDTFGPIDLLRVYNKTDGVQIYTYNTTDLSITQLIGGCDRNNSLFFMDRATSDMIREYNASDINQSLNNYNITASENNPLGFSCDDDQFYVTGFNGSAYQMTVYDASGSYITRLDTNSRKAYAVTQGVAFWNDSVYINDADITVNLRYMRFAIFDKPNNVDVDIGSDGDLEYDGTGNLTTEVAVSNFSAELNQHITACGCVGCSDDGVNCSVPINVSSDIPGIVKLSALNVVYNSPPTVSAYGDNPDPAPLGSTITFWSTFTDSDGDNVRVVVCNASGVTGTNCTSSANWLCNSALGAGNRTCTDTTTNTSTNYWLYVCDANACSAASTSTYGSNSPPTVSAYGDNPEPVNVGSVKTFWMTYNDVDGDNTRILVCSSNATTGTNCTGTWYCNSALGTGNRTCTRTALIGDASSWSYYTFPCDAAVCGDATTQGTAESNHRPTVTSVNITPSSPSFGDTLTCNYGFTDSDGDSEDTSSRTFDWFVNHVSQSSNTSTFSSFSGGDVINCSVLVVDEHDFADSAANVSLLVNVPASNVTVQFNSSNPFSFYFGSNITFLGGAIAQDNTKTTEFNYTIVSGNTSVVIISDSNGTSWVPASLVSVWHFDENTGTTAFDEGMNDNDGTIVAKWGDGVVNTPALNYTAANFTNVSNSASLNLSDELTLSVWFNSFNLSGANYLLDKRNAGCAGYGFYITGGNKLVLYNGIASAYSDTITLSNGSWYHVAVTVNSTNATQFYVNGKHNGTANTNISKCVASLIFGNRHTLNYPLDGVLDEVMIFNTSLSASEVQSLYNNTVNNYYQWNSSVVEFNGTGSWNVTIDAYAGGFGSRSILYAIGDPTSISPSSITQSLMQNTSTNYNWTINSTDPVSLAYNASCWIDTGDVNCTLSSSAFQVDDVGFVLGSNLSIAVNASSGSHSGWLLVTRLLDGEEWNLSITLSITNATGKVEFNDTSLWGETTSVGTSIFMSRSVCNAATANHSLLYCNASVEPIVGYTTLAPHISFDASNFNLSVGQCIPVLATLSSSTPIGQNYRSEWQVTCLANEEGGVDTADVAVIMDLNVNTAGGGSGGGSGPTLLSIMPMNDTCGDGICQDYESVITCPIDCGIGVESFSKIPTLKLFIAFVILAAFFSIYKDVTKNDNNKNKKG